MVVLTSRCPSNFWTVRMSCPSSSRWVANEWRKEWQGGGVAGAGRAAGAPDSALEHGLVQVVPAPLAGHPVYVYPRGREHPLPAPLPARVRVLPHQRSGKLDPPGAALEILPVLPPHTFEVPRKVGLDDGRQHRHTVLRTFARPYHDLVRCEVA